MKRSLSIFLVLCLVLVSLALPASAEAQHTSAMEDMVTNYLDSCAKERYLFEDVSYPTVTVKDYSMRRNAVLPEEISLNDGQVLTSELEDNITFAENKVDYFREHSEAAGMTKHDFSTRYIVRDSEVSDTYARLTVDEGISFTYDALDVPSSIGNTYFIDVCKIDGEWLIADITSDEWTDMYKAPGVTFNEAIELASEPSSDELTPVEAPALNASPRAVVSYPYDHKAAAAYARTYVDPNATGGSSNTYYNTNFYDYSGTSVDCQNFASQAVYAGLGGSNNRNDIDYTVPPMDNDGTQKWYGNKAGALNWAGCEDFRNYAQKSNSTTGENRLVSTVYQTTKNDLRYNTAGTDMGITSADLLGSVLHGPGTKGPLGHAVVVSIALSTQRSNIYFTAHTNNRYNVSLSENYPTENLVVIIPQYFDQQTGSSVVIRNDYLYPSIRGTYTLSATVNTACKSMSFNVFPPSGSMISVPATLATGGKSGSVRYNFTTPGLYTIITNVTTTGGTLESNTYTVRIT